LKKQGKRLVARLSIGTLKPDLQLIKSERVKKGLVNPLDRVKDKDKDKEKDKDINIIRFTKQKKKPKSRVSPPRPQAPADDRR